MFVGLTKLPFILQILIHFLLSLLPLWNLCLQLQKGISLLLWQCLSSYQWSFFYSILNKRNLWLQYCWFFKFVCFFNTSFFFFYLFIALKIFIIFTKYICSIFVSTHCSQFFFHRFWHAFYLNVFYTPSLTLAD